MMQLPLPISINELIHGHAVEWERIEFKEGWNPKDTLHTICAFANDFHNLGGGYIIVGIEEKDGIPVLPPKGLMKNQLDKIQKELLNLGHSTIQPMYHPISVPYVFFPGPDRSIKIEDIASGKAVSRRYRNRRIGEFLKELDLTEGRSTGIGKINRAIEQNGSPKPVFETDDDRSFFLARFPVHSQTLQATGEVAGQVTEQPESGEESQPESRPESLDKRVLRLLINDHKGKAEISTALGQKDVSGQLNKVIRTLLTNRSIEMTIPDKPNSRLQKYRLTDKGKQILEKNS